MSSFNISGFQPKASIAITTPDGVTYAMGDLQDSLISLTIQRSVDGTAGAFGLTLTATTDKNGNTWADLITPMSYIEIRMGNLGSTVATLSPGVIPPRSTTLPMRFRGFVDNSGYTTTFGATGGPQRAVLINGRDYMKLFMVSNIQYLWTSSTIAASMAAAGFGLTFNYGLPWQINTVSDFVNGVIGSVFNGDAAASSGYGGGTGQAFLPAFREGGVAAPNIQIACSVPDKYQLNSLTVQPFSGPFINLLSYFQSPPLGEMFIYDDENAPVLVYRVTPLKDEGGMFVLPAQDPSTLQLQLPHVLTTTDFNPGKSVGRSDNEVVNFVFVYGDTAATDGGSSAAYASSGLFGENFSIYSGGNLSTNPYWNSASTRRFGLRPLNIDSPWVPYLVTSNYQQLAIELATFIGQTMGFNEKLYSGSIPMHGDPLFIPGRYCGFTDRHTGDLWSFYLESCTDVFNFKGAPSPGWNCQLGVTRGFKTSSFASPS